MYILYVLFFTILIPNLSIAQPEKRTVWLDELDISKVTQDRGQPMRNKNTQGNPISMGGQIFQRGVGTHASSTFYVHLNEGTEKFIAMVGLDDAVRKLEGSPQEFMVIGDDSILWRSGLMDQVSYPKKLEVDLSGIDTLLLMVRHGKGKFRGVVNWAEARFVVHGDQPVAFLPKQEEPYILTPKTPAIPQVNGAKVIGFSPGVPILYKIPATGSKPLSFSIRELPEGLRLNPLTGIIEGEIEKTGTYILDVVISNDEGEGEDQIKLVIGDKQALTPPMGWNNWNVYGKNFDENIIRETARHFVKLDLINHGWSYVNMDDGWQGQRGGKWNAIQANEKFVNIKKLCSDIHQMGLKIGIYSTPWKVSYAGYIGSSADTKDGHYPYEYNEFQSRFGIFPFYEEDAKQWAEWGIDYMKYDWHPNDLAHTVVMQKALKNSGRDIVFSLSNSSPYSQIEELSKYANSWRTTGDIIDNWGSVYSIVQQMDRWNDYSRPGHWNDADMLVIGWLGASHGELHPSRLSPTEQYTHVSLWAIFSSPLLLGCDLSKMDEFTLNLLTNDEVIAINQDPLGKGAKRIYQQGLIEIWVKHLSDGNRAVALCNFGLKSRNIQFNKEMLSISESFQIRDVWRQKDLGSFKNNFKAKVPGHGVLLLKVK